MSTQQSLLLLYMVICSSLAIAETSGSGGSSTSVLRLWYDEPAKYFAMDTLPIGNGKMGAMIFGDPQKERIQFNEDSLWLGDEEATGCYQNFGHLYITFGETAAHRRVKISDPSNHHTSAGEQVDSAFDLSSTTKWCMECESKPAIAQLAFANKQHDPITSYAMTSANDIPDRDPKDWIFQGSDDAESWVEIDQRKDEPIWKKRLSTKTFEFENDKSFKYYRFVFLRPRNSTHFQVAEITLNPASRQEVTNYVRELNLQNAVHTITYTKGGVNYKRQYFCSNPDNVIVLKYTADKSNSYTGMISLVDAHDAVTKASGKNLTASYSLKGRRDYKPHVNVHDIVDRDYYIALDYESQVQVVNKGGTVKVVDDVLVFQDCDSLMLVLSAGTDYLNQREKGWKGEHPHKRITADLKAASKRSFVSLLDRHVQDYRRLFGRVAVDVGSSLEGRKVMATDRRIEIYNKEGDDPDFEELVFQYARYLMISSSRPGSLPANLQGLWNHSNAPPWASDYHSDVNLQMNYWFTQPANLAECFEPYAEWLWSILPVRREDTANVFGTKRGWMTRAANGIFGGASYIWVPGDAPWLLQNIWDQYAFTQDEEYLKARAYPMIKELCEFWEDFLIERPDGTLVSPKSVSPEHGPEAEGNSYEQQLVYDLFTNYIEASVVLGVDQVYREKVKSMRSRLLAPKIGKWGQLQEWAQDRDHPEDTHRHLSHMIAVYPGHQITMFETPKLAEAAIVSLNARGDGGTGWSMAWKVSLWSRLGDGQHAHRILKRLLRPCYYPGINMGDAGGTYSSLLMAHPPFQIEANFGYAAGFCEMLLQSHDGTIHLLPALPEAWPSGKVTGLVARGNYEVDMEWKNGELTAATIRSRTGKKPKVRISGGAVIEDISKESRIKVEY